jgi:type I restriction enzyme S subunit
MSKENKLYDLPPGWIIAKLSDMVIDTKKDFVDGPFGSNLKANEYRKEGVPIFKIQNIKAGYFLDKNIQFVSPEKAEDLQRHTFQLGDIIITKLGEPLGLCCKVPSKYPFGVIVADLMRIRPSDIIVDTNYLTYVINSNFVQEQFKNITKGTTRARVNLTIVRDISIPLPPLNEQKRIASKLDEFFSELEKSTDQLNATILKLRIYRQSILKHAFEGRLTEGWRKENKSEKAATYLQQLESESLERYKTDIKQWEIAVTEWKSSGSKTKKPSKPSNIVKSKLLTLDEVNTLPKIPSTWIWVRNNDLLYYVTSGSRDWKKYYSKNGANFIRTQDIKTNVLVFDNMACVKLPENVEGKRSLVQKGDLLMTITGANVGKIAHVNEEISESYVSQSVALMKPIDVSISSYLHIYFQSNVFGGKMINDSVYGVGRPVLSLENIRDAPIALPPLKEQIAIVEEIESQMTIINNFEGTLNRCINQLQGIRYTTLRRAFAGNLLSQEIEDESAEVSIERIKNKRIEYYQELALQNKTIKKRKKMSDESPAEKDLLSILKNAKGPITAKELWEQSSFKDDIEEFYSELKKVQLSVIEIEKGILLYQDENR